MRPPLSSSGPATSIPSGPASIAVVMTAVITFARSASGVRMVMTPISGALTSGPKIDDAKSASTTPARGSSNASAKIGIVSATNAVAPRRSGSKRVTSRTATTLPSTAPAPNAAKNSPATLELVVLLVGENGQPRDEHLAEPVRDQRGDRQDAQHPVAEQEPDPREHALASRPVCGSGGR